MASNTPSSEPTSSSSSGKNVASDGRPRSPSSPTSPGTQSRPSYQQHRPNQPSQLRLSHMPSTSPEDQRAQPGLEADGIHPQDHEPAAVTDTDATHQQGAIEGADETPNAATALLERYNKDSEYTIRPRQGRGYGSFASTYAETVNSFEQSRPSLGGRYVTSDDVNGQTGNGLVEHLPDSVTEGLLGKSKARGTTSWLRRRAGIKKKRLMYINYYIPFTNWIQQYRWGFVKGDLISAITMASFYVPMALSYASNLSHMPPINGLYAFVFNPFLYAILGTCPQMVVGPEAAGSLLTGSVVAEAIKAGHFADDDGVKAAQVGGMVTGMAGAFILVAGILRLGFLDSVLSRPFLRGFISSIGLVIFINQLLPEMGLDKAAEHSVRAHGSPLDALMFISDHRHDIHKTTAAISFSAVAVILFLREMKRRLQPLPKLSWVVYIPDRFIIVVLSAVFAWRYDWQGQGVDILGDIRPPAGVQIFEPHWPFAADNFKHVSDAFETAFIIALLGFFESCVAAKSLGSGNVKTEVVQKTRKDGTIEEVEESDGIRGISVSSNRELVALGVANIVGGAFMAIPAFGGYGRSKINASTGARTPMSSIFLSLITVLCTVFLLPYFYYIPKGVLSAMITVVSISLLEEAPHDILFFWRIGGYIELFLMLLVFLTTFFVSLRGGIIVGIIFSLIRLMKHATRPRVQILGRVPGTREFENAEVLAQEGHIEMIPNSLIVKIPEPLTFANTGSLKDRLKRLEDHGTAYAHPALPSVRSSKHNKNIIFDIHGVTGMDYAAAQVLVEIVKDYKERGTGVYFCRIPSKKSKVWALFEKAGIVDLCGGEHNFYRSVDEALRATEKRGMGTFHDYIEGTAGEGSSTAGAEGSGGSSMAHVIDGTRTPPLDDAASFTQDEGGPGLSRRTSGRAYGEADVEGGFSRG
ncbi:Putative SLC26A/SulP transporter, STAS domain, STAS domain superfamily [Septoria linicola]|uniref:SLC26A/SulP transporter, STAS domain, STAS domain superfamily n=1 Tax=Septoria linicola TaxID=215465 RepID=A0A9Q9ARN4_9PEZI|nr:Putative SLC26A/SulP transporter, STAS domain, STAS domain superfamily [Septoria linicola]